MLTNGDISVKELRYLYVLKLLDEKKEMEVKEEEVKEILSFLVSENDDRFLRNPTTGYNKIRETFSDIFMNILFDLIGKDYKYTEISIISVGNRSAAEILRDFFTSSNNSERSIFDYIKESNKAVIFMSNSHAVIWLGIYFLFYFIISL